MDNNNYSPFGSAPEAQAPPVAEPSPEATAAPQPEVVPYNAPAAPGFEAYAPAADAFSNVGGNYPPQAPYPQPSQQSPYQQQAYQQPPYQQSPYQQAAYQQQPYQQAPYQQQAYPPPPYPQQGAYFPPSKTNLPGMGQATASLVLDILGLLNSAVPILGVILAVVGLVFGILGRMRLPAGSTSRATAGIILSSIALVISLVITIAVFLAAFYYY